MRSLRPFRLGVAVLTTLALAAPLAATTSSAAPARADTTKRSEARRVDRVPTPRPKWFDCSNYFGPRTQCATVRLPLDYDRPRGAKTDVAMLRIKARDQQRKIGSLFLNPGGPGGSGVGIAAAAPYFLPPEMLARFDIVGFDPRGTNFSDNVRCFRNVGQQADVFDGLLTVAFPWRAQGGAEGRPLRPQVRPGVLEHGSAAVAVHVDGRGGPGHGRAPSRGGRPEADLPGLLLRQLPRQRLRQPVPRPGAGLAIDGVLDPIAWAGTRGNRSVP